MRKEPVEADDLEKLETRLEKKYREEAETIINRITTDHAGWQRARDELNAKWVTIVGNHRDLKKELDNAMAELSVKQKSKPWRRRTRKTAAQP